MMRTQPVVPIECDSVVIDERCLRGEAADTKFFHIADIAVANGFDDFLLVFPGLSEIASECALHAALGITAASSDEFGGMMPIVLRHATPIEAAAAPFGFFYDAHFQAALRGEHCRPVPPRTRANDDEIVLHFAIVAASRRLLSISY